MFYLELCSHFLFWIFMLAIHFLWLHLIMFSLASLDNVSLASLDKVSLATIGFFTSCQQSSLTLRTSFKTGAFFFGCDWFIDLASTSVISIWIQLSNLRFLPSNGSLASLQRPQPWQEFNANRFFKNLWLPAANQPFSKLHHLSSSWLYTYLHLLLSTKSVPISIPFFICYLHTKFHFTFCLHHIFHSWYIYLQILSSLPFTI